MIYFAATVAFIAVLIIGMFVGAFLATAPIKRRSENHDDMYHLLRELLIRDGTSLGVFPDDATKKQAVTLTSAYRKAPAK